MSTQASADVGSLQLTAAGGAVLLHVAGGRQRWQAAVHTKV